MAGGITTRVSRCRRIRSVELPAHCSRVPGAPYLPTLPGGDDGSVPGSRRLPRLRGGRSTDLEQLVERRLGPLVLDELGRRHSGRTTPVALRGGHGKNLVRSK